MWPGMRPGNSGFNSRAHEGRDLLFPGWYSSPACFNSRAHEGRDARKGEFARGCCCFNSRAHEGRDWCASMGIHAAEFQFTRPRRARPCNRLDCCVMQCFNSRAHEGRDHPWAAIRTAQGVSIHAPTKGATSSAALTRPPALFQFTRPRRARLNPFNNWFPLPGFQFTRPRRARLARRPSSTARL